MSNPLAGQKIIMLLTRASSAGVGRVCVQYAETLRDLGANLDVWAIETGGTDWGRMAETGFPIRELGLSKHGHLISTSRRLAQALAEARPDWVHAHTYEAALHASRAKTMNSCGRLIINHHDARMRLFRRLIAWPYRDAPDVMIAPSPGALEANRHWFGYEASRCVVIGHPVAEEFMGPRPRDEALASSLGVSGCYPVIMWVARIKREKGHGDLVRALPAIVRQFPEARLVFVGEGKYEHALRRMAARLGVARNVVFAGLTNDVPAMLSVCDVFACASHAETSCIAVQEAMASAKPVVSTAVWGPIDYIEHGRTGLLTPIGAPRALADSIIQVAQDTDLSRRLAEQAHSYARHEFSSEVFVQRLSETYQQAMDLDSS